MIKPRENSPVSCEIQIRTLFEEIWGEIAHMVNYPEPSDSVFLREQIGVLARWLVLEVALQIQSGAPTLMKK